MANDTNITLTPEEQELIRIKREEDKLAKEKEAAEKAKRDREKVLHMEKQIEEFKAEKNDYEKKVLEFYEGFNQDLYELRTQDHSQKFEAYNYIGSGKPNEVLATKHVEYREYRIVYKQHPKIYITIKEHETYGRGFRGRRTNHGYFMYIQGYGYEQGEKRYKTANKIQSIIAEREKAQSEKENQEEQEQLNWEETVSVLKDKYPGTEVEKHSSTQSGHDYSSSGRRRGRYFYTLKRVIVKFSNGLEVTHRFYRNLETDELEITAEKINTDNLDKDKVIETLKNV